MMALMEVVECSVVQKHQLNVLSTVPTFFLNQKPHQLQRYLNQIQTALDYIPSNIQYNQSGLIWKNKLQLMLP